MNPYFTDARDRRADPRRRPPRRAVRIVVAGPRTTRWRRPPSGTATAELPRAGRRHLGASGTVVHAKILIADDVVSFGTVNLDAWALYRNSEIMMLAAGPEAAER